MVDLDINTGKDTGSSTTRNSSSNNITVAAAAAAVEEEEDTTINPRSSSTSSSSMAAAAAEGMRHTGTADIPAAVHHHTRIRNRRNHRRARRAPMGIDTRRWGPYPLLRDTTAAAVILGGGNAHAQS